MVRISQYYLYITLQVKTFTLQSLFDNPHQLHVYLEEFLVLTLEMRPVELVLMIATSRIVD